MTETERLAAIEAIKQTKAHYWRGVDLCDDCQLMSRTVFPKNKLPVRTSDASILTMIGL